MHILGKTKIHKQPINWLFFTKNPLLIFGHSTINDNLFIISIILVNLIRFIIHATMHCKLFPIHSQISSLIIKLKKLIEKKKSQNKTLKSTKNKQATKKAPQNPHHRKPSFLFFCHWRGISFTPTLCEVTQNFSPVAGLESSKDAEFWK